MYQRAWKNRNRWRLERSLGTTPAPPPGPKVAMAAALVWEEHCVECAVPSCYSACPLYVRRADGKCARFAYGIAIDSTVSGLFPFGADIRFQRWAKLEAYWPGRPSLYTVDQLRNMAWKPDVLERAEASVRKLPLPGGRSFDLGEKVRKVRKRLIRRKFANSGTDGGKADALFVRFYYPGDRPHRLQIEIDQEGEVPKQNQTVFRRSHDVARGWNELTIPASELPDGPGKIRIWPDGDEQVRLIFTWLDVVAFENALAVRNGGQGKGPKGPAPKVKCVAWDLDGTLWDGIIGEDGPDGVDPRPEALDLVRRLDDRGIIQTIASKNDFDRAWPKIEELGLSEHFLYPAIHWGPKSGSIRKIAVELNINVDTFAFIDDSAFERAEVARALPQVRVYDAARIDGLSALPEFDVPVTEVSRTRRQSYLAEARRRMIVDSWEGDNDDFLRSCKMVMRIGRPSADQVPRCLELLQRSNQFNLSAIRYSDSEFQALLEDKQVECFAFDLTDSFGTYGVVGFAAVRRGADGPVLVDFVMSCRAARKRVEDTFIHWYADQARRRGTSRFFVCMRRTDSNGPLRDALLATPLTPLSSPPGESNFGEETEVFEYDLTRIEVGPQIIQIEETEVAVEERVEKRTPKDRLPV